ncbi:MAG: putative manganese-dependent inorganic diphosphatase [Lentisphaerae bacterium]|nr:putative manganese-dependent inorganic diphosphatase [Lentisphaerota bacterium]
MPVYVIGHKNPDTDSICAAIGYAYFLRQAGMADAEPACCGEINARTQYVLATAGIEHPRLIMDVRPTVGQIAHRTIITARENESLFEVYRRMRQHSVRALPVLDTAGALCGLISFASLMELVLPDHDVDAGARFVETSLDRLCSVLDATAAHAVEPGRDEELIVTVAAMSAEGFTRRMKEFPASRTLVVTGDRPTVQAPAIAYGVRVLIITGGYELSAELREEAIERGVSVLLSPHDTATTTLLIRSAKRVTRAITREFLKFSDTALVEQCAEQMQHTRQALFPVMDESGALAGVFSRSDLVNPRRMRLVLVDHNELSQAVTGAEQAEILEVIDHHRLGGVMSREPIRFINEPVGSTSTIVSRFLRQRDWAPPKPIALCLAAGIVADTLNLTSPTTTDTDRDILAWLAKVGEVNVAQFAERFFAAGSTLQTSSPDAAVRTDCKEYRETGWRFAVAQIEELGLDHFDARQAALREALSRLTLERGLDFAALMITDIGRHFSLLMIAGDRRVVAAVDYPERETGLFEMDGVVSRKKQLLPHLTRLLAGLKR